MFFVVSCLLFTVACGKQQVQPALSDSDTKDYIHGWTFPTTADSAKSTNSLKSKGSRDRMLTNETDNYKRAWTFPVGENGTSDKSSVSSEPHPDLPKTPPSDDTEEYLNGWVFE